MDPCRSRGVGPCGSRRSGSPISLIRSSGPRTFEGGSRSTPARYGSRFRRPLFDSPGEAGPGEKLSLPETLLVHVGTVFPENRDHDMKSMKMRVFPASKMMALMGMGLGKAPVQKARVLCSRRTVPWPPGFRKVL